MRTVRLSPNGFRVLMLQGALAGAFVAGSGFANVPIPECEQLSLNHAAHSPKEAAQRAQLTKICQEKRKAQAAHPEPTRAAPRPVVLTTRPGPAAANPSRPSGSNPLDAFRQLQAQRQQMQQQQMQQQRQMQQQQMQQQRQMQILQQQRQQQLQQQQRQQQGYGGGYPPQRPAPTFATYGQHPYGASSQAPAPAAAPAPAGAPSPMPGGYGAAAMPFAQPLAQPAAGDDSTQVPSPGVRDSALVHDQTVAKLAHIDLGVFGITIGEPLGLAQCPSSGDALSALFGSSDGVKDTCVGAGNWLTGMIAIGSTMGHERLEGAGFKDLPVTLASTKCPDWLAAGQSQCLLFASMKNGYVASLFFTAGGEDWQTAIEAKLTDKYKHAPTKDAVSECKRRDLGVVTQQAHIRVWTLPGLRVSYDPLGALCASNGSGAGSGLISVESASYHAALQQAVQHREESQPKM